MPECHSRENRLLELANTIDLRSALTGFCLVVGSLIVACNSGTSANKEEQNEMATATPVVTEPGTPGERWGDFIFVDPANPPTYARTPAASGPVPNQEGIPDSFPGTRTFASISALLAIKGVDAGELAVPAYVPDRYELIGGFVVFSESGLAIDFLLSYRIKGQAYTAKEPEVFSPSLTVGWSKRFPRPLAAETTGQDVGLGRKGLPRRKLTVRGLPALFQEWQNPADLSEDLKIRSSLNWFDAEARLWHVQAVAPLEELVKIAESLRPVGP